MPSARQTIEIKRRIPRQSRALETSAAIVEAAAQVLEAGGLAGFTTNAVAERAGVSIGTLYQYFADKQAIVQALAKREIETALPQAARALAGEVDPSPEGRVRAMVKVLIGAVRGRQRARKAIIQAVLSQGLGTELMTPIARFIAAAGAHVGKRADPAFAPLTEEQVFVLSRAMLGTVRAAVLEEQPFLRSQAFEDEVVRLVLAYLGSVTQAARG